MTAISYSDFTDPVAEAHGVAVSHRGLLADLESAGPVAVDQPTRLPGWPVGAVLTHLAGNARSQIAVLDGRPQYEDGWEGRNQAIAAGSTRPWPAIVDDLAGSSEALDDRFRSVSDWDREVRLLSGAQPAGLLPLARRREVEVHRLDLGLGYRLADVPADYVTRDSSLLQRWWIARHRPADRSLPTRVAERDERDRWAWLVGRLVIDGIDPAALF